MQFSEKIEKLLVYIEYAIVAIFVAYMALFIVSLGYGAWAKFNNTTPQSEAGVIEQTPEDAG